VLHWQEPVELGIQAQGAYQTTATWGGKTVHTTVATATTC
jgi:hypothetical protein